MTDSGKEEPLVLGRDAIISSRVEPAPALEADLVFVGHGLSIPEAHHDDFAGLDVRGKLVVFLNGAPTSIPGPLAAHKQSPAERAALLKRLGAIGTVSIPNPKHMDVPWERFALARFMPSMSLADPAMDESRGLKLAVIVNPAHADKLLAGSGHTFAEIVEAANSNKPLPHFALPARLKATTAVKHADVVSQNVVAMLPGSDPKLKDEYVVFTAHLDHLGIGKPINGDAIYNGAMDNASGIAAMLDVAAMLKENGTKLRRSVLFVAVTAEEKGLLGSKFFANAPTVDPEGDRRQSQHRYVHADLPAQEADDLRHGRVRPRGRRRGGGRVDGRDAAARPGAFSECLHPQRSVQLHPARRAGAGAEGGDRQGLARGEGPEEVADRALPRAVGRRGAAGGQAGRRGFRRAGGQAAGARRQPRQPAAVEGFVVLQEVRSAVGSR